MPPYPPQPQATPAQGYGYPATGPLSATGYAVPSGAYPGAPGWPVVGPAGHRNGLGTAALVLGVIAACLSWTFVLSPVVLVLGVLALIFGIVGARRARGGGATNRTAALGGLWTGAGSVAIAVVHVVLLVILGMRPVEVDSEAGSAYLAEADDTVSYEDGLLLAISQPVASADGAFVTVTARLTNDGDDGVGLDGAELVAYADDRELDAGQVRRTDPAPGGLEPGETQDVSFTVAVPGGTAELGVDLAPSGDHDYSYWVFTLDGAAGGGEPSGIDA
ncbi:hypothetical protein [Streptomyces sp. 6N223]|uniref:hypothetical protein n=1 Tax=Streptomyces sp. 6N223 TaxID=3457412 RepID=UPI003FD61311